MARESPVAVSPDARVYELLLQNLVQTPITTCEELWTAFEQLAGALKGYVVLNDGIMQAALERSAKLPGDLPKNLLSTFARLQKGLPTGSASYDRLVELLCDHGYYQLSIEVLRNMMAAKLKLGVLAELSVVRGFIRSRGILQAEAALEFMTQLQSIKYSLHAASVQLLLTSVAITSLEELFVELKGKFKFKPTLEDYNVLLDAYARVGDFERFSRLMAEATRSYKLNVDSYNALLQCLWNTKQYVAGLRVLELITHARCKPTTQTLRGVIDCAGMLFQMKFAQAILDECESNYGFQPDVGMWTSLLVAWCRAGKFETAVAQFSRFRDPALNTEGEVPASLAIALLEALQMPNSKVVLEDSMLAQLARLHFAICGKGLDRLLSESEVHDLEQVLLLASPRQSLESVKEAANARRQMREAKRMMREEAEREKADGEGEEKKKVGFDAFVESQPAVKSVSVEKKSSVQKMEEKRLARLEARKRRSLERRERLQAAQLELAEPEEQFDRNELSALADLLDSNKYIQRTKA